MDSISRTTNACMWLAQRSYGDNKGQKRIRTALQRLKIGADFDTTKSASLLTVAVQQPVTRPLVVRMKRRILPVNTPDSPESLRCKRRRLNRWRDQSFRARRASSASVTAKIALREQAAAVNLNLAYNRSFHVHVGFGVLYRFTVFSWNTGYQNVMNRVFINELS